MDNFENARNATETPSIDQDSSSNDTSSFTERSPQSSNTSTIPPRGDEIDRWQRHISMQNFARDLQRAANSIYPNHRRSRYTEVYVLILKWKTEDPNLPVTIEIAELCKVLDEIYHYNIEIFEIPDQKSHATVSKKINAFVDINGDSKSDLKIVYYAGAQQAIQDKRSCLVKVSTGSTFWPLLLITADLIQLAGQGESEVLNCDLDWNPTRIRTGRE